MDGGIVQCIPLSELAYHVGADKYTPFALHRFGDYPNNCTIGIELCHLDWRGEFTEATLDSAACLCAGLCDKYDLEPTQDITTHNAITGKDCPRWFVQHPEALKEFCFGVRHMMVGELA